MSRWISWVAAVVLGGAFLAVAGAGLFVGLGLPLFVGGAIGVVLAVIFAWTSYRLRKRAILIVVNCIVSLLLIFQALYLWLGFVITNTSPDAGLAVVALLIPIFFVSFKYARIVPPWVLVHEVINLGALIVVNFSWLYWNDSLTNTSCMGEPITKTDSVYFTLTTLATVGYGDIHPASEECRRLVSLQIICGFLFAGIIFALLVSRIGQAPSSSADDQQLRATLSQVQERLENLGNSLDTLKSDLEAAVTRANAPGAAERRGKLNWPSLRSWGGKVRGRRSLFL